jgi:hypothetical protein
MKRQEVYFQLVSSTATIGNAISKDPERVKAETQFWQLFWGACPMDGDSRVSAAADDFSVVLYERPDDGVGLRNASMNLARACRKSLGFLEYK